MIAPKWGKNSICSKAFINVDDIFMCFVVIQRLKSKFWVISANCLEQILDGVAYKH